MVLHIRRTVKVRFRKILGFVKDRISIGRVRLRRRQRLLLWLQVAVICATSHHEAPAEPELLFQADSSSHTHIAQCMNLLLARLHKTKSWIVAIKCLTLIHKALCHEGFMLFHFQLRFHPRNIVGENYLNLSKFRDRSSAMAWEASSWIRWYAKFVEGLMDASRQLRRGLDHHYSEPTPSEKINPNPKVTPSEKINSMKNDDLMMVIMLLHGLLHEICKCPLKNNGAIQHGLIQEALRLVVADSILTQDELRVHLKKIVERLKDLSSSHISELIQVCEMLTANSAALVRHTELAIAMNLLQPQQCPERICFVDYELLNITTAMKESQAALAMTNVKKKDVSSGLIPSSKLAPPGRSQSRGKGR